MRIRITNAKMIVNKINLSIFLFFLLLTLIAGTDGIGKYIALILISFGVIAIRQFKMQRKQIFIATPVLFYVIFAFCISSLKNNLSFFSFRQFCFLVAPVILAIALFDLLNKYNVDVPKIQFLAIVFVNLIFFGEAITTVGFAESQYAFIFGAYVIYFFYKNSYKYSVLAFLMLTISNKRIALAACIIILIIFIIYYQIKNNYNKKVYLYFAIGIALLSSYLWVYFIKTGMLNILFSEFNINTFGRNTMWGIIDDYFEFDFFYLGEGLGYVLSFLDNLGLEAFALLHCDILHVYIELGFIGFAFWMILQVVTYKKMATTLKNEIDMEKFTLFIMLFMYTVLNYTTDNIIIYINYWFPLNIMILSVMYEKHNN